jgi:hypothetical protein
MANSKKSMPFGHSIEKLVSSLIDDVFGLYRPEQHYMRGPGPKWREKHLPQPQPAEAVSHRSEATA